MMRCPFCDADLSDESTRIRGGRCPHCGSILMWSEEAPSEEVIGAAPREIAEPPDEDNLSIKDVVRTIVARGANEPLAVTSNVKRPRFATPPDLRFAPTTSESLQPPPKQPPAPDGNPQPLADIDKLWRGSMTVASRPSTTLKTPEALPDPGINDLLIRPVRISSPGEPPPQGTEYEMTDVIGEGGVGVVYAARQASVDRTVAIKMLRADFAHKRDHRNKFLSEAVVTGELDHPNIVPIHDLGTSEAGSLFYAMKRVRGTPWSEVIARQSLPENLRILLSVADAIAFAHSRGVIHRDLKPENVMLGKFGEVVVMDWGIALSTGMFVKSNRISQSTSMGGTPAYMAPEMATGPLDAIGPASDVYLLGAILFEIVSGQPPHAGHDVMSCLYAAARNEIRPTKASGELLEIAMKAMATRPQDRYATVQEFQAAIREYQSHSESIVLSTRAEAELAQAEQTRDYQDYARALYAFQEASSLWSGNEKAIAGEEQTRLAYATTALNKQDYDLGVSLLNEQDAEQAPLRRKLIAAQRERKARQTRLRRLRQIAFALAAAIFLVVSVGLLWIASQKRQIEFQRDELQAKTTELERTIVARDSAMGQLKVRTDELGEEKVKLESSNTMLREAKADADAKTRAALEAQQDEAAASYLAQIGVAAERIANNSFRDAERLLLDYDAGRSPWSIFRHWEWGHLKRLCDLQAGQQLVGPRIEVLTGTSDGKLLAAGTATGKAYVLEVDWRAFKLRQIAELTHAGAVRAVALDAVGNLALAGDFDQRAIVVYDRLPDGSGYVTDRQRKLSGNSADVLGLSFSPRPGQLLSTARDGTVRLWDVASGKAVQRFVGHSLPVWSAAFSPDGSQVVTAGEDGTVRIWQTADAKSRIYRGHDGPVYAVAWSPHGNWIASAGEDRAVHVWPADKDLQINYQNIANQLQAERTQKNAPAARGTFHQPRFLLQGHTAEVRALAFSANGQFVFSGANDNTVRRWNYELDAGSPDYVTVFRGHGGWIRGCAGGLNGRYVASGSLDGFVKLWDAAQYEEVRALRSHDDAVLWAGFSRDGQRIVTAGRDRQALVWSLDSREPIIVLDEGDPQDHAAGSDGLSARLKEGHEFLVTGAALFPDGRRAITSAGDGTVRIWDVATGGQIRRLSHTGTQGVLALSQDGKWILTGSDSDASGQQGALLWTADDPGQQPVRLAAHPGDVSAVAISPGSELAAIGIATGDVLGNVRLWRYQGGTWQVRGRPEGHSAGYPITAISFSPDGRRLFTASQDRSVMVHDTGTGDLLPLSLRHQGGVKAMQIARDGSRALTLCMLSKDSYRVGVWDLATGSQRSCDVTLPNESLTSAAFHPDQASAILTSTSGNRSRFWRWDLVGTSLTPLWPQPAIRGTIWSVAFSIDGSRILVAGGSRARLLSSDRGLVEQTFSPHGPVTSADFSPSGRLVATGSLDGDVKIWITDQSDPRCGRVALKIPHSHGNEQTWASINTVCFSPQEADDTVRFVTAGDDGTAQIWRMTGIQAEREHVLRGHTGRVRSALYSPDGRTILTASDDKTAHLWDVATGQQVASGVLKHDEAVLFAAFSPDGTLAITGCDDNNAYLWDLKAAGGPVKKLALRGHAAAVTSVAISPDNRRAITGSQDGIAKLWDVASGKEILNLKRHTAELTSVHFSPAGDSILTSGVDRTAILWPSVRFDAPSTPPATKEIASRGDRAGEPGRSHSN
jgi:WD40 repeat protein/serine/threonine protein kinase